MEVLVLDGKNYVKATKAARDLGYASDYVGQLCRKGQVDARLIGRTWYVNQDELGTHRVEKKRMAREKAREHARKAISEVRRLRVEESVVRGRSAGITYEPDEKELIPEPRKLTITTDRETAAKYTPPEPEYDSETVILNKGERVVMSGDIKVVDVTDSPVEPDIVVLTPRKIRRSDMRKMTLQPKEEAPVSGGMTQDESEEGEKEKNGEPVTFMERLEHMEEEETEGESPVAATEEVRIPIASARVAEEVPVGSVIPYVVVVTFVSALILATVPATKVMLYSAVEPGGLLISYTFSLEEIKSYLSLYF